MPCETFKATRKGRVHERTITCDGKHATVSTKESKDQFAVYEVNFPDAVSVLDAAPDKDADVVLGIDVKQLARLADGMGTDAVVLRIRTTDPGPRKSVESAISVVPITNGHNPAPVPNARGVIMPITLP